MAPAVTGVGPGMAVHVLHENPDWLPPFESAFADEGVELTTTLLAGKPFEQTMKYVREVNPTTVVMGRIGYHSDDEMDIGGNIEMWEALATHLPDRHLT